MILSFLAGRASNTEPPEQLTIDPEASTVPYIPGLSQPYNAPVPMITPTYATNGGTTHPSVVDFGPDETWNGHRYWLALTEYAGEYGYGHDGNPAAHGNENPYVYYSDDGFNWEWPSPTTNPISWPALQLPAWTINPFNADTELAYDSVTDRLWCFWREINGDGGAGKERCWRSWSSDGSTWSTPEIAVAEQVSEASPTIAQAGDGTWKAWTFAHLVAPKMYSLSAINGTWTFVGNVTGVATPWHGDVIRIGSAWYMIGCNAKTGTSIYTATSTDGLTWTRGGDVMVVGGGGWDNFNIYRPTMQPHPDGVNMRVWYGSDSTTIGWHCGYTIVPRSRWPVPA